MDTHFEWKEEMSVGEATIDSQHQRLLAQVNKLIDAMLFGASSEEVALAVRFLGEYAEEHLAYEEKYMADRGYADIEEHKKKHQDFRDRYASFKKKLESGNAPDDILMHMEVFLGQWWVGHIGHEDRKYYLALGASTT